MACRAIVAPTNARWQFQWPAIACPCRERTANDSCGRFWSLVIAGKLAIAARCLQETNQQQIRRRSEQHLNEFWGLTKPARSCARPTGLCARGNHNALPKDSALANEANSAAFCPANLASTRQTTIRFLDSLITLLVGQGFPVG